jgi:hypothetical protein
MSYLYSENVSPQDRFDQISIQMDNGSTATLRRGHVYDLTSTELSRAGQYIVLVSSDGTSEPPDGAPTVSGNGVNYVATNADLPPSAIGHPVVLVLEDSSALDGAGNPQATLRYWSGTDWRLLGLSGGGAVASDFIDITLVGSPLTGQTIVWDAANSRFVPGELVPA